MLVGVFLRLQRVKKETVCLPHACGGVSRDLFAQNRDPASSPCLWGCFLFLRTRMPLKRVFPMLVGVFLKGDSGPVRYVCLPHACGGVSKVVT